MFQERLPNPLQSSKADECCLPGIATRLIEAIGIGLLLLSLYLPWFVVPTGGTSGSITESTAHAIGVTWLFRSLSVAILLCWAWPWFGLRYRVNAGIYPVVAFSLGLLLFPYAIATRCPTVAGEAAWLHAQHESLTTTSGDIYASQENGDILWRQRTDVVNRPINAEVLRLPEWNASTFAWGRFQEMMGWLGFSPWFGLFLRKGWVLALSGATACLVTSRRRLDDRAIFRIGRDAAALLAGMLALAVLPPLISGCLVVKAKRAVAVGDYSRARRLLEAAAFWTPTIREDGRFIFQAGLFDSALKLETPEARYYQARVSEEHGFALQARSGYLSLLSEGEGSRSVKRACVRAVLRQAISAFDTGEVESAIRGLEHVLRADPCNLKANYALQLAFLRKRDAEGVSWLKERMEETYRYFNTPTKEVVLANASENLAFACYLRNDVSGAMKAWKYARRQ